MGEGIVTDNSMFAKLIFTSLILQLAAALRPIERRSGNACTGLGSAGCQTCSGSGSNEICLTCKDKVQFITVNKKAARPPATQQERFQIQITRRPACVIRPVDTHSRVTGRAPRGSLATRATPPTVKRVTILKLTGKSALSVTMTTTSPQQTSVYLTAQPSRDTNEKKCKACNPECAECVGPANSQCSACPAGKALTYGDSTYPNLGGTCGDACTVDKNGCKVCGARIGGTDYCSQCSGTQVPISGVCVENASGRAALCTAKGDGTCASCAAGDLLKDGGCYKTDRLPGRSICTTASNNKCTKCANGLNADGNGVCGECHSTCATCSAAGAADKCRTCATGYYKENADNSADGTCKRCSEKIPGCKQCTSSSADSIICLESEAGTGGSVNKSGLSTGAIAGIAVAVVIVVGGLVGFLCWWFLCRGKA
ncbi:VSP with INR [Giardia lamblia P15]|uniref:VSP with INR n=1 Tax=Giardia intestinalis (strain P15) TaxID=658858 RepID=E1F7Z9_GIAIA|nr:VSP with INR [Giardia lamblia P15]